MCDSKLVHSTKPRRSWKHKFLIVSNILVVQQEVEQCSFEREGRVWISCWTLTFFDLDSPSILTGVQAFSNNGVTDDEILLPTSFLFSVIIDRGKLIYYNQYTNVPRKRNKIQQRGWERPIFKNALRRLQTISTANEF